jgi:hypothetical protein
MATNQNQINEANVGSKVVNRQSGIVVDGHDVAGGYFVTESIEVTSKGESGKIPDYACVDGALCYCKEDNQFYKYNQNTSTWEVAFTTSNLDSAFFNSLY